MKLPFIKSKVFYKYLISYTIALFVPLIVLSFIVNSSIVSILKHDIINANTSNTSEVRDRIDDEIKNLRSVASQIMYNPKLTPYSFKYGNYSKNEAMQELEKYIVTGNFVKDIFYYIEDDTNIYSSAGVFNVDWLLQNKYYGQEWSFNEIYPIIRNQSRPIIKAIKGSENTYQQKYIAYIYPINDFIDERVLIFLIEDKVIRSMMDEILKEYNQNIILLDENNDFITSMEYQELTKDESFKELLTNTEVGSSVVYRKDKQTYLISMTKSTLTGWTYISVVNYNKIMEKVHSVQQKMIFVVFVLFIIGAVFIIMTTHLNYNPVKNIFRKLESANNEQVNPENEFEFIEKVIDRVFDVNKKLAEQIEYNKPILRQHLLKELIRGKVNRYSELMQIGSEVGLLFQGRLYFVVIIKLIHSRNEIEKDLIFQDIYDILENKSEEQIKTYKIDTLDNDTVAFIISGNSYERDYINTILLKVKEKLHNEWNISSIIGVGPQTEDILMIGTSYIKAVQVIEKGFAKDNKAILYWDQINNDLNSLQPIDWFVNAESKRLTVEIKNGNVGGVRQIIQNVIDKIVTDNIPLFLARCLIYDVINTIMRILIDLRIDFKIIKEKYLDMFIYEEFENIGDLQEKLKIACESICELIVNNGYCEDELMNKIFEFIAHHFCEPDFSLNMLSEHTGVSASYISNYFKEKTGCTISSYLWEMRLEKSKELLRNTGDSVTNIVKMVGYIDTPNFVRKFKSAVGITPGEYREKFKSI